MTPHHTALHNLHAQHWHEVSETYSKACQQHTHVLWSILVLASSIYMNALPVLMLTQVVYAARIPPTLPHELPIWHPLRLKIELQSAPGESKSIPGRSLGSLGGFLAALEGSLRLLLESWTLQEPSWSRLGGVVGALGALLGATWEPKER